jgi:hypothetical protein
VIPGGPSVAKASYQNGSDGEGRKLGAQTGLDTRVVPAVNDARYVSGTVRPYLVP